MKAHLLLLACLLLPALSACGPSPAQVAATATASRAQTQTAAPTATPLPSATPTATSVPPTATPVPTDTAEPTATSTCRITRLEAADGNDGLFFSFEAEGFLPSEGISLQMDGGNLVQAYDEQAASDGTLYGTLPWGLFASVFGASASGEYTLSLEGREGQCKVSQTVQYP